MKWLLLTCLFISSIYFATETQAQVHHHNGHIHNHPHTQYHYHNYYYYNQPRVIGYQPIIQWYPYGTNLNIGPTYVSPNRSSVRIQINSGFYRYHGYSTFNLRSGRYYYYPR